MYPLSPTIPFFEMTLDAGDRFLMYTDGMVEPEDAGGDSFGDCKLEQVVRDNQSRPPSELLDQLLAEIQLWQPTSTAQQYDLTFIVIDAI